MPRFAIVVPAYNAESTLAETLDAILAQEFEDWECIIVDDGSTDGTAAIALTYVDRDSRFRLISQENQGTAGAYNTGVETASAEFIVICSADDLLLPAHLRAMDRFILENHGYDIYSCNGYYWLPNGQPNLRYTSPEWQTKRSLSLGEVIASCFFSVGAAYRRWVFDSIGGYRLGVYGEDYDFWLRAMARGAAHCYSPARTTAHRITADQKSSSILAVTESDIQILESLIESSDLRADQLMAAREAIGVRQKRLTDAGASQLLHKEAESLRVLAHRLLGVPLGDKSLALAHRLTWLVRPIRTASARWRAARKRC